MTKHGTVPAAKEALEASAAATSATKTEQADAVPAAAAAKEGDGSTAPAPASQPAAPSGGLLATVKNMFSSPTAAAEKGPSETAAAADGQDAKVAAQELSLKPFNPTDGELLEWIAEQKSIQNIASKTVSVEQVEMLQGLPVRNSSCSFGCCFLQYVPRSVTGQNVVAIPAHLSIASLFSLLLAVVALPYLS